MTGMLFAEYAPRGGRIMVVGAGGGIELRELVDAYPNWVFDGVASLAEMHELAASNATKHLNLITMHDGTIEVAPKRPIDAVSFIVVFHRTALVARLDIAGFSFMAGWYMLNKQV